MKKWFLLITLTLVLLLGLFAKKLILPYLYLPRNPHAGTEQQAVQLSDLEIVATGLHIPWDITFIPSEGILISERSGTLYFQTPKGSKRIHIESLHTDEGGLLGLTLHPHFEENRWIYLYNTTRKNGKLFNRVERYRFENGELSEKRIIVDDIPGAPLHDGGRLAFGPDGLLYITTGDAGRPLLAQDLSSLAGKILRVKDEGSIPPDNPFHTLIWTYGHRNPQGITWDPAGNLWSTEHGPSGKDSGFDELNFIVKGHNYGWPHIKGDKEQKGMVSPVLQSGKKETWAPASALYWNGRVFFGGLRGEALYEALIEKNPPELRTHLRGMLGRIRAVVLGPDGYFYISTSNTDGRGFPKARDDKIYKIDPNRFLR